MVAHTGSVRDGLLLRPRTRPRQSYSARVIALTLDNAKTIAIVVATVLVVGSIASLWLMRTVMQKLAVAAVLALLAFAVWTQRVSLQDCADAVRTNFEISGGNPRVADTECSFFGVTVTISDPRSDAAADVRS